MEYKNEDIVKYVEGMINHERVVEFLKANINLEEDYQFKCRNVYEYIEGMMKYNEVQYRGYIDRVYFKEIEKFLKFYIIAYLMVYKAEKVNLKQQQLEYMNLQMKKWGAWIMMTFMIILKC